MSEQIIFLIVGVVLGIIVGALAGWFLAPRAVPAVQSDGRVEAELRGQIENLRTSLSRVEEGRMTAERSSAAVLQRAESAEERLQEVRKAHQEEFAVLKSQHEQSVAQMRESFNSLGLEALTKLQPQFLTLANEVLSKHTESAKGELAKRQESIATMLAPVLDKLQGYQERLAKSEVQQSEAYGEVRKHLQTLSENSASLTGETLQLRRVLSSNQARGRWGEETLRRVVEVSGMSVHCDFVEQAQVDDKKPDLIVNLPGDRVIIVDSKVPDIEALNALGSGDETKRAVALKAHAEKLRGTIKALADRDYPAQFPKALDYIVLFVPAESLFSAALEGDSDLIIWAAQRKIMLATPTSLIALLKSVSLSWQQNDQAANAKEIAAAAEEMYSRIATFVRHFDQIRSGLENATHAYNSAVGSYDRSVRPQGERILRLGVGSAGKQLPEVDLLTEGLRPASKP